MFDVDGCMELLLRLARVSRRNVRKLTWACAYPCLPGSRPSYLAQTCEA